MNLYRAGYTEPSGGKITWQPYILAESLLSAARYLTESGDELGYVLVQIHQLEKNIIAVKEDSDVAREAIE